MIHVMVQCMCTVPYYVNTLRTILCKHVAQLVEHLSAANVSTLMYTLVQVLGRSWAEWHQQVMSSMWGTALGMALAQERGTDRGAQGKGEGEGVQQMRVGRALDSAA